MAMSVCRDCGKEFPGFEYLCYDCATEKEEPMELSGTEERLKEIRQNLVV